MTPFAALIWLLNLLFDTGGHLLFKRAAIENSDLNFLEHWTSILRNGWLWLGIFFFGFEIVLWIIFLSLVPLSTAVLLASLDLITIMLGGYFCFNEKMTLKRVIGIALITGGVALTSWGIF